jgi:hypothetical protein
MKAWKIVVILVIIGIIGGWVGYWIGHALGWTTNAEFPLQIGGGDRAIGLSILLSFGSVMAGLGWFVARPLRRIQRLTAIGTPAHATIRRTWRTGLFMNRRGDSPRHQLGFELEVHPDGGQDYAATGTGVLTEADEAALKPGTEATVRIDPTNPSFVVVVGPMAASAG